MPTLQEQLQAAVVQTTIDSGLLHTIIHGDTNTTVTTEGGPIKSIAQVISENQATLAGSIVQLTTLRDEALVAAQDSTAAAGNASASQSLAQVHRDAAQTAALSAEDSKTQAEAAQAQAANSATAASQDANNAAVARLAAETAAISAETHATSAATSQALAAIAASRLSGTSVSSVAIGLGEKTLATQSGKIFDAGTWVIVTSDANPNLNWMFGQVITYDSTDGNPLTVLVTATGGGGTHDDWTIRVSGVQGASGGVEDGDKGDIIVSSGGSLWELEAGVVSTSKLAANSVTLAKMANGNANTLLGFNTDGSATGISVAGATLSGGVLTVLAPPAATTSVQGIVRLATNAEVVTGSDSAKVASIAALGRHRGMCKAWGRISNAGVLNANSFGVSSVSLSGAIFTVNLSTSMANTDYAVLPNYDGDTACNVTFQVTSRTLTSFTIKGTFICVTGTAAGANAFSFAVFGQ